MLRIFFKYVLFFSLTFCGFYIIDSRYAHIDRVADEHISYDLQIQDLKKNIEEIKEQLHK